MAAIPHPLPDSNPQNLPPADEMRIGIVVSKWNQEITTSLLEGALQSLKKQGARKENVVVRWVPGSYELPLAADWMLSEEDFDAVICLGCVIQGETRHFEFICQAVSQGIMQVGIKYRRPVIFGVLTADTLEQAVARSGGKLGNKGIEAAISAIEMIALSQSMFRKNK